MPSDLNVFRNAVAHAGDDSFIRMSSSRPGQIVNYGKFFLGRFFGLYRHGTVAQNQNVREQLFRSLEAQGNNIQTATLANIRIRLGIDATGQSTQTTQLTAREIKQILADVDRDNANAKARKDFAKTLAQSYSHPSLKELVAQQLGLDDPQKVIVPFPETEQELIRQKVKNAGLAMYEALRAEMNLPDTDTLRSWITDDEIFNRVSKTLTAAATEGIIPDNNFKTFKANVNEQRAFSLKPQMEAKIQQALVQLTAETGVDCSAGKNAILSKLMEDVSRIACKRPTIIHDTSSLNGDIDEALASLIQKRKAIIMGILKADPKLDPVVEKKLLELTVTDLNLKGLDVALILSRHISMAGDLFELTRKPEPTMTDLLDKIRNWEAVYGQAVEECRGCYKEFGSNELRYINEWLVTLAKGCYKAKYGTEPQLNPQLEQLFKQLNAEMRFIQANPDAGMNDKSRFCAYSHEFADAVGLVHYLQLADACIQAFDPNILYDEPPADGLSLEVGTFMSQEGGVGIRHPYPLDEVIDQQLGSAFKSKYLVNFREAKNNSTQASMVDYNQMFQETTRDLSRLGITLRLGDKVISLAGKAGMEGNGIDDIRAFFEQDGETGINAARVLSGILHQGVGSSCNKALMTTGEACGGMFSQFNSYVLDLQVTRQQNGTYQLDVKYNFVPANWTQPSGESILLDPQHSRVSYDFTVCMNFQHDDKKCLLDILRNARIHTELTQLPFTQDEYANLQFLRDPETQEPYHAQILTCPELANDARLKELLAAPSTELDQNAIFNYVKDKIITRRELHALYALGLNDSQIEQLTFGLDPNARLTKDLLRRLNGSDREQREAAFNELTILCRKLVVNGWQPPQDFDINDLTLVTVGGLKMDHDETQFSELVITRNYIKKSADAELSTLITALASNSTQRVAFAKMRLAAAVTEARRAMGLDLLKTLNGTFSPKEIDDLKNAPDDDRVQSLLENIVLKNEDMERSIQALKDYARTH